MSMTSTAKRRRKQMRGGEKHLPPLVRPKITKADAESLQKRQQRQLEKMRAIQGRKKG